MQSFPQPATVDAYTDPADRGDIYSPVMVYHERSFGKFGMQNMLHEVEQYFGPLPNDFDSVLWLSQIAQAYVLGWGVEYWRRQMPRTTCTLIWQLNDSWPGPTWSMIDWYHRWKAIMYASKRFYAPVLVTTDTNAQTGQTDLWVCNDRIHPVDGHVHWQMTDTAGRTLHQGTENMHVSPHTSEIIAHLPHEEPAAHWQPMLIWTQLKLADEVESSGCHFTAAPKALQLHKPKLDCRITKADQGAFHVAITSDVPALWVWLNLVGADAAYSDNFFHLDPARPRLITVRPQRPMNLAEFRRRLHTRSVYDLMTSQGG